MARLRKADAEALTAALDTELLQHALALALRRLLEIEPFAGDWGALVSLAAQQGDWPADRKALVVSGDLAALEHLAVELNERRSLG